MCFAKKLDHNPNIRNFNRQILNEFCNLKFVGHELGELQSKLDKCWEENEGSNILYMWTEKIRDYLFSRYERAKLFIESPEEDKQRERKYIFLST